MAGERGVDEDFEDFVTGAYAGLSRTAALLAGSRVTGEDLLHEALLRTYLAWGRIDHGLATGYVRRVMVNLATDWWRRRRWQPAEAATLELLGARAGGGQIGRGPGPDPGTGGVEDRDQIVRLLGHLSAKERAVVVLRYYVDLPEREVAAQLGCSLGTVKSTASRALDKLAALDSGTGMPRSGAPTAGPTADPTADPTDTERSRR